MTNPTTVTVSSINWINWIGGLTAIQIGNEILAGYLTSVQYDKTTNQYYITIGNTTTRIVGSQQILIADFADASQYLYSQAYSPANTTR